MVDHSGGVDSSLHPTVYTITSNRKRPKMKEFESWEDLVDALRKATWQPAHQSDTGTIAYASDAPEFAYGDAEWYFEEPPDSVDKAALLTFLWESHGAPISWGGSVDVLWIDQDAYVSYRLDSVEEMVDYYFAKITPGDSTALFRQMLLDLMSGDDNSGFADAFHRLPNNLTNLRPDLIDQATLREGCWRVVQARSETEEGAWQELHAFNQLNSRSSAPTRETVTEPPASDADLDETTRHRMLDEYFAISYVEE